eukprot:5124198-Amphidinium_carterae.2
MEWHVPCDMCRQSLATKPFNAVNTNSCGSHLGVVCLEMLATELWLRPSVARYSMFLKLDMKLQRTRGCKHTSLMESFGYGVVDLGRKG